MKAAPALLLAVLLAEVSTASAQILVPVPVAVGTIAGARYGRAEIIRARGEAAVSMTNAMINYEEARSRFMDNRMKWTETYWARRRLNEAERAKDVARLRARRDAWRNSQGRRTETRNVVFEPETGTLDWPAALAGAEFQPHRAAIEHLFALKAGGDGSPAIDLDIRRVAGVMRTGLRERILDFPVRTYMDGRGFLDTLVDR